MKFSWDNRSANIMPDNYGMIHATITVQALHSGLTQGIRG